MGFHVDRSRRYHANQFLPTVTCLIAAFLFTASPASAADADATLKWLEKVRDHRLEFHNRVKYGMRDNVLGLDPNQVEVKWTTIHSENLDGVDPRVFPFISSLEIYERTLQEHARRTRDAFTWFFIRVYAEDAGGKPVRQVFNLIPDERPEKQDVGKIVKTLIDQKIDIDAIRRVVGKEDHQLRAHLKATYPAQAKAMLTTLDAPYDLLTVTQSEVAWLKKHRQDLLDRQRIHAAASIACANAQLDILLTPERVVEIQKFGGNSARIFAYHDAMAKKYDELDLPQLSVNHHLGKAKHFQPAFAAAMLNKAEHLIEQGDRAGAVYALQMSTLRASKATRFGQKYFPVVRPADQGTVERIAELAGDYFGYIGRIDTAQEIVGLDVAEKGNRLVTIGPTALTTYNLFDGKRDKLIALPDRSFTFDRVTVTPDAKAAYLLTSNMKILRANLVTGKLDPAFTIPLTNRLALIDVSPDGSHLAVCIHSAVTVYNTQNGQKVSTFRNRNASAAYHCSFTADGRKVILGGLQGFASFFDMRTGKMLEEYACGTDTKKAYVYHAEQAKDGTVAIGGGGYANVYRRGSDKPVRTVDVTERNGFHHHGDRCYAATLVDDGKYLVTSFGTWDVKTGESLANYNTGSASTQHIVTVDRPRLIYAIGSRAYLLPIITGPTLDGAPRPQVVDRNKPDNPNDADHAENAPSKPGVAPDPPAGGDPKLEAEAKDKLTVAKLVLGANLKRGRELLEQVITKYPDTQAAAEAARLLGKP